MKVASFPCRHKKLADLFLVDLKHGQKRFIRIPSFKRFRNEARTVTMETMIVGKIATSVLALYFQVL